LGSSRRRGLASLVKDVSIRVRQIAAVAIDENIAGFRRPIDLYVKRS
jgi:hypothetical protein